MYPARSNFNTAGAGYCTLGKCNNINWKMGMRKHKRSAENIKYIYRNIHIGLEWEIKDGVVGQGHNAEGLESQVMSLYFTWTGK